MSAMLPPTLPPGVTEAQWSSLSDADRQTWWRFGGDVAWLMKQPQFRRVMFRFLDDPSFCGAFRGTYAAARSAEDSLYLQGRREAGIDMQVMLQHVAPHFYARMLQEEIKSRATAEGWDKPDAVRRATTEET